MLYAVYKGHTRGIFSNWVDCKSAIDRYSGAKYRKFNKMADALRYLETGKCDPLPAPLASSDLMRACGATAVPNDSLDPLVIYTDGSCGNVGGVVVGRSGIWYGSGDPRNRSERLPLTSPTNNRAELWAAIRAIETLECPDDQHVIICSDSRYTINSVCSWWAKWENNGWNQKTVKNEKLIRRLHMLATGVRPISFMYTPGHSGVPGNEGADSLADYNRACDSEQSQCTDQ